MKTIIFDGEKFAVEREAALTLRVREMLVKPKLFVVVFAEDEAGQIYAGLKQQAAERIGIGFERVEMSISDKVEKIQAVVWEACTKEDVTGVMVQKPSKQTWKEFRISNFEFRNFEEWWGSVTDAIDPGKDVDCLTRFNLDRVYAGESNLLPATAKACLAILGEAVAVRKPVSSSGDGGDATLIRNRNELRNLNQLTIGIVGRSELVGRPLAARLEQMGAQVQLLGSGDDLVKILPTCEVVVSATGRRGLVTGEMVKDGAVVIDVGAPGADVDFASVAPKASFITPVPGGVGPVTVVSLMENVVGIAESR